MSTIRVNSLQNTSGVEMYTAKAWVNFNGTGTVAIRASGNVSSITDNGTGSYIVNFTNAMPDVNYAVASSYTDEANGAHGVGFLSTTQYQSPAIYSTTQFKMGFFNPSNSGQPVDKSIVNFCVFR